MKQKKIKNLVASPQFLAPNLNTFRKFETFAKNSFIKPRTHFDAPTFAFCL